MYMCRKNFLASLLLAAALIQGLQGLQAQPAPRPVYKVGDTVCGGIIFYIRNNDTLRQQHGLICASQDASTQDIPWYNGVYDTTHANLDKLFDLQNALTVLRVQGNTGQYAALLCSRFYLPITDKNCYLDSTWYLPSRLELDTLYANLGAKGIGNFAYEGYWSSVEGGGNNDTSANNIPRNAWIVDFFDGKTYLVDKANQYKVRPVREFQVSYSTTTAAHNTAARKTTAVHRHRDALIN